MLRTDCQPELTPDEKGTENDEHMAGIAAIHTPRAATPMKKGLK
jgi:hypothetical protein